MGDMDISFRQRENDLKTYHDPRSQAILFEFPLFFLQTIKIKKTYMEQ